MECLCSPCALGQALAVPAARPGSPGTALRQRFALRVVATVVRRVARGSGTTRLAVRTRPTADLHRVVVSYPWRHRGRAQALGHAVAGVLDALPASDVDAVPVTATTGTCGVRMAGDSPSSDRRT